MHYKKVIPGLMIFTVSDRKFLIPSDKMQCVMFKKKTELKNMSITETKRELTH